MTCPDLIRFKSASLPKVPSSSSLPRVKSQASIGPVEAPSAPDLSAIESASEIIQDLGDPRGLASVICLEHYGRVHAPALRSSDSEALESCLFTPTEEDSCAAEGIWRQVISTDIEKTFLRHHIRKRKWKRAFEKGQLQVIEN